MEKNMFDRVIEKLESRQLRVNGLLEKQFGKKTPFRMKPMTKEDKIKTYDSMTKEDWYNAFKQYGENKVTQYKDEMEVLKAGRNENA